MQLDRFTIPDNQSYIWKLNSYQLSHRIMQLWLEPEDPISKAKRFRMTFLSVEYFEGTTTWIAASFRKGTYNEWVDVWHRMGKIIVPYSPNYLYRIFDVFSLYIIDGLNSQIKIVAGGGSVGATNTISPSFPDESLE